MHSIKLRVKFSRIRKKALWKTLKRDNFYEGINNNYANENAEKTIAEWIYDLKHYKNIRVEKFKDLFSKMDEIVFPITIDMVYHYKNRIEFTDSEGKRYYMYYSDTYDKMEEYTIGRRKNALEPLVYRDFCYRISKDNTISLIESSAFKLKEDGKNDDGIVSFIYTDTSVTEAKFQKGDNIIKIKYPRINAEFDKKVLKFFFDNNDKWYYYNILPILRWLLTEISDKKSSISIVAEVGGEISSEINLLNGIIHKYTKTEIINEEEICITKRIFMKDLYSFLQENALD